MKKTVEMTFCDECKKDMTGHPPAHVDVELSAGSITLVNGSFRRGKPFDLCQDCLDKALARRSNATSDWAFCPRCGGSLDTGWECVKCRADWRWVK